MVGWEEDRAGALSLEGFGCRAGGFRVEGVLYFGGSQMPRVWGSGTQNSGVLVAGTLQSPPLRR